MPTPHSSWVVPRRGAVFKVHHEISGDGSRLQSDTVGCPMPQKLDLAEGYDVTFSCPSETDNDRFAILNV